MKKKVLAVVAALTVMVMGSVTVFAESPTVNNTQPVETQKATVEVAATSTPDDYATKTTASEGFKVVATTAEKVTETAAQVKTMLLNDVAHIGEALGNKDLAAAATDSGKKVSATVLSVVEVSADTATKNADGKYVVTLNIEGIKAGDSIAVLHFNTEANALQTIVPTKVEDGKVTFESASLSPIGIVKLEVSKVTTSPKTGETLPMAAMVFVVGLVGMAVCGKKYFA